MRTPLSLIATIAFVGSVLPLCAIQTQQDAPKSQAPAPPSGAQTATTFKDALAPEPTPALKILLVPIDEQFRNKQFESALSSANVALKTAQVEQDRVGEAMAQRQKGVALDVLKRTGEAIAALKSAAELWRQVHDGPGQVEELTGAGILLASRHPEEATQLIAQAIAIAQAETRRPLKTARVLMLTARRAYAEHQLVSMQSLSAAALSLFEKFAPGSREEAVCLGDLGAVAFEQDDFVAAEGYYKRALSGFVKVAQVSPDVAGYLGNLDNVAYIRGDFAAAEDYHKQALAIWKKLAPRSLDMASILNNQGNISLDIGYLVAAEDYNRQALDIANLSPDSIIKEAILDSLGNVAQDRGDREAAEHYYELALKIGERVAPFSRAVVGSLTNLGNITYDRAQERDDSKAAERYINAAEQYYEHAMEIAKRIQDSRSLATELNNLGNVARYRGNLPAAESYHKRVRSRIQNDH